MTTAEESLLSKAEKIAADLHAQVDAVHDALRVAAYGPSGVEPLEKILNEADLLAGMALRLSQLTVAAVDQIMMAEAIVKKARG